MKQKQNSLYDGAGTEPMRGGDIGSELPAPRKRPAAKKWLFIAGGVFLFYAFVGELFLPEALRISTFLGTRAGHVKGMAADSAAPDEARANCVVQREQLALQRYNECLQEPYATGPKCEFARDQALQFPCGENN